MIVGVFNRPNHPEGWGFPRKKVDHTGTAYWPDHPTAVAHGYVTLFVRCADDEELGRVEKALREQDFHGVGGFGGQYSAGSLGQWFGGRFDLVATVPDVDVPHGPHHCLGDNRMVAVFDAADVLIAFKHG